MQHDFVLKQPWFDDYDNSNGIAYVYVSLLSTVDDFLTHLQEHSLIFNHTTLKLKKVDRNPKISDTGGIF